MPAPTEDMLPAAIYRGETSRTCYKRGVNHLSSYRKKENSSVLWKHARYVQHGALGPGDGINDYQMVKRKKWTQPLHRLTAEGHDIMELEELEYVGAAVCLNTKEDFQQSHKVSLSFGIGNRKER